MDVIASLMSALSAPGQGARLLQLHTPLGPDVLVPENCHGIEAVSGAGVDAGAGFRFDITALSVDARLQADDLLGQPVLLTLLTADSRTDRRPFHGHVTHFEYLESNGGLARYALVIEPWTVFLQQWVDSHVYQDMTVMEALDTLFGRLAARGGVVAPRWRWDLADNALYLRHSLAAQLEEDGLAFMTRILSEQGLFFWFEHQGNMQGEEEGQSTPKEAGEFQVPGSHTLVIADYNSAFSDLGGIRYHRSDVTEQEDAIQQWRPGRRAHAAGVRRATWDYRSLKTLSSQQSSADMAWSRAEDDDSPTAYAWHNQAETEWRGRRHIEVLEAAGKRVEGNGTWRRLRPGGQFQLHLHPGYAEDATFLCLAATHHARNNLSSDLMAQADQRFEMPRPGFPDVPEPLGDGALPSLDSAPESDFYRNGFVALQVDTPFRPMDTTSRHGQSRIRGRGLHSAVVTADNTPVHTDRDHRIKMQYPWQRGEGASSGESHPESGIDNAPASAGAWTWVRTLTPWAGEDWGGVAVPRTGQESLTLFLEGQPERPVAIGTVFNGQGNDEAQHNQVGGGHARATGNAAPWFNGNDHKAVYTGLKSQALSASQQGNSGHQWILMDSSEGQSRAEAGSTQHQSRLSLGHLKGGKDNLRQGERGFGADLSTVSSGALRAGQGVLLSTEAGQWQMSTDGAQARLQGNADLLKTLNDAARNQNAGQTGEADELPSQQSLSHVLTTLKDTRSGSGGEQGGAGSPPGWSRPLIVATSPDGLASITQQAQTWVAGTTTTLVSGADINWMSKSRTVMTVSGGLSLYNNGAAPASGKPNQESGIQLHAAQGKVSARAPKQPLTLAAAQDVALASTNSQAILAAPNQPLLLASGGAYLKLDGGNIELGAPGGVHLQAAMKQFVGPASASAQAQTSSGGDLDICDVNLEDADRSGSWTVALGAMGAGAEQKVGAYDEAFQLTDQQTGEPLVKVHYRIVRADGTTEEGTTNEQGMTHVVNTDVPEELIIEIEDLEA
ncbi:Rhs element Vgr protein [Alloalcanivorax xenomutans]|uniref:type VI secretion system Vgr family protein n=1 Tax=Alloalcanivorax xenomutans TaxID=1094342 RepID=UPI000BD17258|nr:type VI secretion system tip protein VgrG [Alloalcanivorax xenomutans]SOB97538.1 Rhs element Vgr protein [Alloalcanivorax xenomutans]